MDYHAKLVCLDTMVGRDGSIELVFRVCSRAPTFVHLTRCPNSKTPIFSSFNLVLIVTIDLKFDCWKQLPTAFSDHVYILKYKPVSGYHCRLFCGQVPIIKSVILGGCGALVAWHGILTPAGSKVISGLIVNYTLPALLFSKMVSCLNLENVQELGLVALVAIFYIAVGAFFGVMIQKLGRVRTLYVI
ncbi:hypothetical protein MVEG_02297 [Podila verticillata NRRL 6337]|nr:hypothetical protein MVEG_02297 [Podila verticillata NRRL 6337]